MSRSNFMTTFAMVVKLITMDLSEFSFPNWTCFSKLVANHDHMTTRHCNHHKCELVAKHSNCNHMTVSVRMGHKLNFCVAVFKETGGKLIKS